MSNLTPKVSDFFVWVQQQVREIFGIDMVVSSRREYEGQIEIPFGYRNSIKVRVERNIGGYWKTHIFFSSSFFRDGHNNLEMERMAALAHLLDCHPLDEDDCAGQFDAIKMIEGSYKEQQTKHEFCIRVYDTLTNPVKTVWIGTSNIRLDDKMAAENILRQIKMVVDHLST